MYISAFNSRKCAEKVLGFHLWWWGNWKCGSTRPWVMESDPIYHSCKHFQIFYFFPPHIQNLVRIMWYKRHTRVTVTTRTWGKAKEAGVGLENNSVNLLWQKRTCKCILHTSVSSKENCTVIHLHIIISCVQLQYRDYTNK